MLILFKTYQICPNLINFAQKYFAKGTVSAPASPAPIRHWLPVDDGVNSDGSISGIKDWWLRQPGLL